VCSICFVFYGPCRLTQINDDDDDDDKADLASLICRTRSDQTVVLKHKSRVKLGLKSKSANLQSDLCNLAFQL